MKKTDLIRYLDEIGDEVNQVNLEIWNRPELSGEEAKSADLYRKVLSKHGFLIREVGPEMPHAFIGEYGSGSPVIAVLAEYDALPGLSQAVDTKPNPWQSMGRDMAVDTICWVRLP